VLALLALAPAALAVPPTGSFTFTPAPPDRPNAGEEVSFQAGEITWGGTEGTITWLFGDGTSAAGPSTTHAYAQPGPKQVAMVLTNGEAESTTVGPQTVVVNAPPTAGFEFNPASPQPGDDVLFASDAGDPDGDALSHAWDFGDGVTSPLRNPMHSFALIGLKTVTLTVTDPFGATATAMRIVPVSVLVSSPPAPTAGFVFSPHAPEVGDPVDFASSSFATASTLREQKWDLDNDGQFDDGNGEEVLYTFLTDGQKTVRLRVEDANGKAAVKEKTLNVTAPPKPAAGLLSPAPRVRLAGEILPRGTRVRILEVRAPRGALVRVSCRGKGCRAKQRRKQVKRAPVRFRGYEHFMRAGARLEVFIRKGDTIGSYVRYTIRAGKAPKRLDRCLYTKVARPRKCPS
jgi:PKD repeat protein